MNVQEICKRGYYNKVTLNLVTEPIYGDDIEIYGDTDFKGSVSISNRFVDKGIFKVRINILGVEFIKKQVIKPDELSKNTQRQAMLYRVGINDDKSYLLAYADLIVVRDGSRLEYNDTRFNKECDKGLLVSTAISLQEKKVVSDNIVIVDKVYVYDRYRSCGISRWLHTNIRDIMFEYTGLIIGDMLLIPGDFSDEAILKFGMNNDQYINFLKKHYESIGYIQQKNGLMINRAEIDSSYTVDGGDIIIEKSKTLLSSIKDFLKGVMHIE